MIILDGMKISHEQLDEYISLNGLSPILPEYRRLDTWERLSVPTNRLRALHGDFRGFTLNKGERFSVIVERERTNIINGKFPEARDIVNGDWIRPAIVLLKTKQNNELYVCDGEKRSITASFHGDDNIDALIVEVNEVREVVE